MSQGVLAFAVRSGRLLDARWFPDDVALEDAHFGAPVVAAGPSEAERAFEAAGIAVKTLAKPPGNDELLALYAFYKQATVGDATGERPGHDGRDGPRQIRRLGPAQGHGPRRGDGGVCGAGGKAPGG
jgi:hypothetical protein